MRRVNSDGDMMIEPNNDIVVTADDRIATSVPAKARRQRAAASREATETRPKAKTKRKVVRPRLNLTPLQKLAAGGVAVTALMVGVAAIWHSGAPQRLARDTVNRVLAVTAQAGFMVSEITVAGRERTPADHIIQAVGARHGDPILGVDISRVKDRLEAIDSVRAAAVERRLPGGLHLVIAEREPVALWQNGGTFVLVDREGHQIPGAISGYEHLPLVVGEGAPAAAEDLLTMLAAEPELAARVKAAVRVSGRRWNIHLDHAENGLEVRLPEKDPEAALTRLGELEREHGLTGRKIAMLDMRVPDRLIMRPERQNAEAGTKRKDNGS